VPFLSALKAGVLSIRTGAERQVFAVGPGYLQVGAGGKTTVLVETAVVSTEIDEDEARRDRAAAEEQLKAATADGAASLTRANLTWAQARLDARAAATRH
jgi:F0F1-type ATP synthase epsilon subunit